MKGVTKPVTLTATKFEKHCHRPDIPRRRFAVVFVTQIDRTQWGVDYLWSIWDDESCRYKNRGQKRLSNKGNDENYCMLRGLAV